MPKLSYGERRILLNQYEMLRALIPDRSEEFAQAERIVSSGYEDLYGELNGGVDEIATPGMIKEVLAILDMFRTFDNVYTEAGSPVPDEAKFQGFDGNNETEHFAFARFFVEDMRRYEEQSGASFNSHAPMLDRYRRMLRTYKTLDLMKSVTVADVERVTRS